MPGRRRIDVRASRSAEVDVGDGFDGGTEKMRLMPSDPDAGPATIPLLDGVLVDAGLLTEPAVDTALDAHRAARAGAHGDLTGPLLVPAGLAAGLAASIRSDDHGLRIVLAPTDGTGGTGGTGGMGGTGGTGGGLDALRAARQEFLDDDRVDIVGVAVRVPPARTLTDGVTLLLDRLDFSAPAWVEVPPRAGWERALALLADDGAEEVALPAAGPGAATPQELGAMLRRLVDLDLTAHLIGGPLPLVRGQAQPASGGADHGLLNVLCAVRAALDGADGGELAAVLAATDPVPLLAAVRRMNHADAARVRAVVVDVTAAPVAAMVRGLVGLRLLEAVD